MIEAQIAMLAGTPLATRKLEQVDSVLADLPTTSAEVPLYGNLIAARLHERRRAYGPALAAIRRRDWTINTPQHVTHHREQGRLAAEAGVTTGAVRAYRRYLAIRVDVEPRWQPDMERVRGALARLERAVPAAAASGGRGPR